MDNKEKLQRKYANQKRFLINTVLHEICKSNRNKIKNLPWTTSLQQLLHPGEKWYETNMKKIMQITNVNKIFATFTTMIKHEKHIHNRAKVSENFDEFLRSLVKSLKIKFLDPMRRSVRMLLFKMRSLWKMIYLTTNHEDFPSRQHYKHSLGGVL